MNFVDNVKLNLRTYLLMLCSSWRVILDNQLTVICTTRSECRLIKQSKLNGQTDSHSDYCAHLWLVQNFNTKSSNIVVIDDFELNVSQFKINFVIFDIYLRLKFPSSLVTILHTSGWTTFK